MMFMSHTDFVFHCVSEQHHYHAIIWFYHGLFFRFPTRECLVFCVGQLFLNVHDMLHQWPLALWAVLSTTASPSISNCGTHLAYSGQRNKSFRPARAWSLSPKSIAFPFTRKGMTLLFTLFDLRPRRLDFMVLLRWPTVDRRLAHSEHSPWEWLQYQYQRATKACLLFYKFSFSLTRIPIDFGYCIGFNKRILITINHSPLL